jgi:Xaa-Pro aminopeptidase
VAGGRVFSEVEVDLELTGRRQQQQGFIEPSFPTIAGAGANGAIIHYRRVTRLGRNTQQQRRLSCRPHAAVPAAHLPPLAPQTLCRAQEPNCGKVDSSTLLLVDSGGQYDCGTTDITRTFHFGTPTAHQKRCYTRVLQGHIALDRVRSRPLARTAAGRAACWASRKATCLPWTCLGSLWPRCSR